MVSLALFRAQSHGDVARPLVDRGGTSERPGPEPLQRGPFVDGDLRNSHLVGDEVMVVFRVGGRRVDQLADVVGGAARRELEQGARLLDVQPADLVGDEPRLAGRHPHVAGAGSDDDRRRFFRFRLFRSLFFRGGRFGGFFAGSLFFRGRFFRGVFFGGFFRRVFFRRRIFRRFFGSCFFSFFGTGGFF